VTGALRTAGMQTGVQPRDRVGVMVVRVWVESGLEPGLRARLTAVDDIAAGDERVVELGTTDPAVVARELESWLSRWLQAP
jgi:hypothetical protein